MASDPTANKRKRNSKTLTRNKRRRIQLPACPNAIEPERGRSPASETFWAATGILEDNGTHYLVEWDGVDPATGSSYEPTWEPHDFVTPALEAEWKETKAAQSGTARYTQSRVQSYGETNDRVQSSGESPEALMPTQGITPVHCLVGRVLQSQNSLIASPQQTRQSRRDSNSLFVGPQQSEGGLETNDLRSCGVVLTSESNDGSASYVMTVPKEESSCNQQNSATVNVAGDTDEEGLSAADPTALVLRHGSLSLPLPLSPLERAGSVGTTRQLLQLEFAEKVQEGGQESGTRESPTQEELEPLEQAGQEPLETHACIFEEKDLVSPALFATTKSSEGRKQQETQGEPDIRVASPSAPANEAIDGKPELLAEAEPVLQREAQRKTDPKDAVLVLPSAETIVERSWAPMSSIRILGATLVQEDSVHTTHGELTAGPNPVTQKPPSCGETDRNYMPRQSENGRCTNNGSSSPTIASVGVSLNSPRKRMSSKLDDTRQSPEEPASAPRPLPGLSAPVSCGGLHIQQGPSQRPQLARQNLLPPIDQPQPKRRWTMESRELPHNDIQRPQHRDPRPMEPFQTKITPVPGLHAPMSSMSERGSIERAGAIEPRQASIQVEPKKNKRRFVNRTRTGCITCRGRKKKGDEAKPECNNCKRSGFVCEGYANKVPWPENRLTRPLPSLQAQKRMPSDTLQLYSRFQGSDLAHILNCEPRLGSSQSTHQDSHASIGSVGGCDRPIAVEEQKLQQPASSWEAGRSDPSRVLFPPEQPLPPAYYPQALPVPALVYDRDASHNNRQVTHSIQGSCALDYSSHRYHHTSQSMGHIDTSPPTVAVIAHQRTKQPPQHPSLATSTAALRDPPSSRSAPAPSLQKTEQQKMLDGEAFVPYNIQLVYERTKCAGAVYRFNNTGNAIVGFSQGTHERCFKEIVEARWARPRHGESPVGGYLGNGAHIATPFHCDYGYNVSIGDNVTIGPDCQLLDSARITIGRNTEIGARVTITTLETPTDTNALKGSYGTEVAKEVHIGENVYIGDNCMVGAGVRIGTGAIVRSGSVVFHDISPDYIARGNPVLCQRLE
ncbi:hypothetical protein BKA66DRAFT_438626 [Pyrenochaeta sp. MPI-SDFR-AT-0127]|nr:hypothetical protein BKA66DRAFT_438626 [Pyrenochaeta sp. MPI-SDFR-AT-0127]